MARSANTLVLGLLLVACNGRPIGSDGETADGTDSTETSGTPDDMGNPPQTEWAGILYASTNFGVVPSRFVECDTGLEFEVGHAAYPDLPGYSGSCDGVFRRYRGTLDDSVNPPKILVEEWLEARWCEPNECGGGCEPDYDSCYQEMEVTWQCDPVLDLDLAGCGDSKCGPSRFPVVEESGWMHFLCNSNSGPGVTGDPCEYPEDGPLAEILDTCAHGYRCWNPEGTLDAGICVPYCDLAGIEGPACAGECVQCSSSERGLCMTNCTGSECNVEQFC
jgi:hypothetical protein